MRGHPTRKAQAFSVLDVNMGNEPDTAAYLWHAALLFAKFGSIAEMVVILYLLQSFCKAQTENGEKIKVDDLKNDEISTSGE
jgi:hypothetical protein